VVWQDPATRAFYEVGTLSDGDGEQARYTFRYWLPLPESFHPFPAFPNPDAVYESEQLFPFFATRVMSAQRPEYDEYLDALGLSRHDATPVEMLARTGGGRATDTVQLIPEPVDAGNGAVEQLFLASGVRYQSADELIERLRPGDELLLRSEPDNEWDARALLLDAEERQPVGYVPGYLLDEIHKWLDGGTEVRCFVERANAVDVHPHLRLLVRLRAEVHPASQ
jgi:hypothetical protein